MTAKSILQIDVDDSAFQRFQAVFEKYQEQVAKLPGGWAKVAKGVDAAGQKLDHATVAAIATADATMRMAANQEKFLRTAASSAYSFDKLERTTSRVASHIKDATFSLLKWSAITGALGGLLGAGGLWGIDRLALSAGGARRSAGGLGISSGEQQAFGVNYGRLVDPNSTLENIANAQNDYSKAWIFKALGISDYQSRDAADLAPDVLQKAKALFSRNPTAQGAQAFGLDQIFSMDELRRLRNTPDSEMAGLAGQYRKDRGLFAVDPAHQRAWQDFNSQLERSSTVIGNTLIDGLLPLAGPLQKLSAGVADVIEAFLKAPKIKEWITEAGSGLESFAKFIGTPQFKADVEDFVSAVGKLAKAVGSAFAWIISKLPAGVTGDGGSGAGDGYASPYGTSPAAWAYQPGNTSRHFEKFTDLIFGPNQQARIKMGHDYFASKGHSEAAIAGLLGLGMEESGLDPKAVNPKSGAQGTFQWLGPRLKQFRAAYGHDPKDAPFYEQLDFAEWELEHTEKKAADSIRRATDPRGAFDAAFNDYARASPAEISQRTPIGRAYADGIFSKAAPGSSPHAPTKVVVEVHNATGGSAVVTGSQVAGQ